MSRITWGDRWRRWRRSDALPALLFASPWIVGFSWFQLYPIAASLYDSLTEYTIMRAPIFIGLDNYRQLFVHDDLFRQALANTIVFTVCSVPLDLAVAFLAALLLNLRIPGRALFRAAFYVPAVIPSVAMAILWMLLLNMRGGLVNVLLRAVGIHEIPWLTSPQWVMPSLILLSVWGVGPTVVIFLAGLQDVPRELYEAARIDGAGPLRLVRHVTIPMVSPVILFTVVMGMIGALQAFSLPYVIFNGGGPLDAVLLYSMRLFDVAFQEYEMGYAAAMAWVLFALILTLTLLTLRLSRRFVHYA